MQNNIYQNNKVDIEAYTREKIGGGRIMKKSFWKINSWRDRVVFTLLVIVTLILSMLTVISYMYGHSETEAFERLRLETLNLKTNIRVQLTSDRETLNAMASLVSERYADIESYEHICKKFESFGLCEEIGILLPGDVLITKHGRLNVKDKISFESEKLKGEYISGGVVDLTNDEKRVIRSTVPIRAEDNNIIAIMYGTIDVDLFARRFKNQLNSIDSYLCVFEESNGQFIIDTKNVNKGNITNLAAALYQKGFSYDKMIEDMSKSRSGYTSFISKNDDEYLYVRYSSVGIEDWQMMVAQPESVVFAGTKATVKFLAIIAAIIIGIMLFYIMIIFLSIRNMLSISSCAASVRKRLLEINQRSESIYDALKIVTEFARGRSAFIVDSYNEEYHYIVPAKRADLLAKDEIAYFNKKLLAYAARHRSEQGAQVYVSEIKHDNALMNEMMDLYNFMEVHKIYRVKYAVIINNNSNIYVLGTLNSENTVIGELLKNIAVCFSMAIYNKKHLERTEYMALADPLTGVSNRMAFKQNIKTMPIIKESLACIYVDVNELHFYNNKFGHAAGDQMLIFIAKTLQKMFPETKVYRMGGDEFLIFCQGVELDEINQRVETAKAEIEEMKYHIAVGVKYGFTETALEEMVNAAESIMRDEKARYYQDKELKKVKSFAIGKTIIMETGVKAVDACMSIMTLRYLAVYCVSLDKDSCVRILAPSYFQKMDDEGACFSTSLRRYIYELVKPEYHRSLLSFLEYDILQHQLEEGNVPAIKYERIDGVKILLKIYPISQDDSMDSAWIFEKIDDEQ